MLAALLDLFWTGPCSYPAQLLRAEVLSRILRLKLKKHIPWWFVLLNINSATLFNVKLALIEVTILADHPQDQEVYLSLNRAPDITQHTQK